MLGVGRSTLYRYLGEADRHDRRKDEEAHDPQA